VETANYLKVVAYYLLNRKRKDADAITTENDELNNNPFFDDFDHD